MDAKNLELKEILFKHQYNIPSFQRDYVWKSKKIDEIYDEFYDSFTNDDNLFLGSIYLIDNDIVDGQQRSTFLNLLVSELFIAFFKNKYKINMCIDSETNPQLKNKLEEARKIILLNYHRFKLLKNEIYLDVYKEYPGDGSTEPINFDFSDTRKILGRQAKSIRKKNNAQDIKTNLLFLWHILNKINITVNTIESFDNMNDVFSSINSKGANLDIWDLLRNDIYKHDISNNLINFNKLIKCVQTEDEELNKLNKKMIDYSLTVLIMNESNKIVSKKDIYNASKEILRNKGDDYILNLTSLFKKMISLLEMRINDQNYKLLWLFNIIEKCNLKQIKTIFWWSYLNGHFDMKEKYEIFNFYKKLIIHFMFYVNINDKRGNKFEAIFKSSDFLSDILNKKYDFEKVFNNNEIIMVTEQTNLDILLNENSDEYAKFSTNNSYIYLGYWLSINEADFGMVLFTKVFNESSNIEHVLDKSNKDIEERHLIGNKIIFSKDKNSKLPKIYSEKLKYYNDDKNGLKIIDNTENSFDQILNNTFIEGTDEYKTEWNIENIKEKTLLVIEVLFNFMKNNI